MFSFFGYNGFFIQVENKSWDFLQFGVKSIWNTSST